MSISIHPITLFRPYTNLPGMVRAVERACARGYLGEGDQVMEFEAALREHLAVEHVLALHSGTAALWLALRMAEVYDRPVITTPLCCLASTETIMLQGGRIVWADVDPETGNIDPDSVARLLDDTPENPAAILTVDWGGSSCDYDALVQVAEGYCVPLIRDAAHYFGPLDPRVDYTCLSFQAIKHVTTGDGGALVCRDADAHERARRLRWFGLDRTQGASMRCYQQVREPGFKMHMNDLAAGFGLANLDGVRGRIAQQRANARLYDALFAGSRVRPLRRSYESSCWLYTVRVRDARLFADAMALELIECNPVHARNDTQPIFAAYRTDLPGMDVLDRELVCLPVGWWLTGDDIVRVAQLAREVA